MHKKSIEAAKKMQEEDGILTDSEGDGKDRCDRKSDSIAALRAKAQEHNAKILEALNKNGDQSFDDSSSGSFNNSFRSDSWEYNWFEIPFTESTVRDFCRGSAYDNMAMAAPLGADDSEIPLYVMRHLKCIYQTSLLVCELCTCSISAEM